MTKFGRQETATRIRTLGNSAIGTLAVICIGLLAHSLQAAAQAPRPVVQLPNGDGPNGTLDRDSAQVAVTLAGCTNVTNPERQSSPASAERCLINANAAIRSGQIADVPALALALRQIPFTNATGNDNVAEMSSALATAIEQLVSAYNAAVRRFLAERQTNPAAVQPTPVFRTNYSNAAATIANPFAPPQPNGGQRDPINHTPFTPDEISSVVARSDLRPSAAQLPNREIPIDTGMAYLAIAADAVIHPEHYVAPGMTVTQTVATARARMPAALDREIAVACFVGNRNKLLSNGGVADLGTCRAAAARNTLEMMANGEAAPYNPARYGIGRR